MSNFQRWPENLPPVFADPGTNQILMRPAMLNFFDGQEYSINPKRRTRKIPHGITKILPNFLNSGSRYPFVPKTKKEPSREKRFLIKCQNLR
jgi:hypothetical protein